MLYDLDELRSCIAAGNVAICNPPRVQRTFDKLGWPYTEDGAQEMFAVLLALENVEFCYQKVSEQCKLTQNAPRGVEYVDADQFEIHWHPILRVRRSESGPDTISFSTKIARLVDDDGVYCGIVTFHLSPDL